jgi:hypothetical protein
MVKVMGTGISPKQVGGGKGLFEGADAQVQDVATTTTQTSPGTQCCGDRESDWERNRQENASGTESSLSAAPATAFQSTPAPQQSAGNADDAAATPRQSGLAERITTLLEDELTRIETAFKQAGVSAEGSFDSRIRALVGVTKTLREVELIRKSEEAVPPNAAESNAARDIDEFREALARRIESFAAAQQKSDGLSDGGAAG